MSAAKQSPRNRIKEHRVVQATELLPHPMNWRRHPGLQRQMLEALYEEVGFARSLLAFELPDGRLQLIDGHLRRDLTPDAFVTVEVLDVTEEEAKKLLLSIDPLAGLATADEAALDELRRITEADHDILNSLWEQVDARSEIVRDLPAIGEEPGLEEQYLILITCGSESEQAELLARFAEESINCKPLTSFGG